MSLCDRCQRPGRCCSGIRLNNGEWPVGGEEMDAAQVRAAIRANPQQDINGDLVTVQFEPMFKNAQGVWHFWCTAWQNGRCSIYHRRPKLCRDYQPASDLLCWHYDETMHLIIGRQEAPERGTVINLREVTITPK